MERLDASAGCSPGVSGPVAHALPDALHDPLLGHGVGRGRWFEPGGNGRSQSSGNGNLGVQNRFSQTLLRIQPMEPCVAANPESALPVAANTGEFRGRSWGIHWPVRRGLGSIGAIVSAGLRGIPSRGPPSIHPRLQSGSKVRENGVDGGGPASTGEIGGAGYQAPAVPSVPGPRSCRPRRRYPRCSC